MYKITVKLSCYNCMNTYFFAGGKACKIKDTRTTIDDTHEICKHYKLSKQTMEVWIGRAKLKEKKKK